MFNPLKFIFNIEQCTPSHNAFSLLGIKIKFLKPEIRKERKAISEYYRSFKSVQDIPEAGGNLRVIQKANAKFLSNFDKFCTENSLEYWLDFGTLLGTIRHKGFIPWDDDLDISMLRDDYNRIIELANAGAFNNTDFCLKFENNGKNKCFIKIQHQKFKNLFIDIFPYDIYNKSNLTEEEKNKLSLLIAEKHKQNLLFINNNEIKMLKHFADITSNEILNDKPLDKTQKPAIFMGIDFPQGSFKVYNWDEIFPLKRMNFEGYDLLVPNSPEKVLNCLFGNYMTLPKDCYPRHSDYVNLATQELRSYISDNE